MGWKVRSDKQALVKQSIEKKGGRQQVRWQVAKYKIQEALASRGQTLEAGLDITDFEYLAKQGLLIGQEQTKKISDTMPELKHRKFRLEEIKDYFVPFHSISIDDFLTTYLNLTNNTHGTWTKFRGNKSIEYEAFQDIFIVLDLNCNEIGTDEPEIPDSKKLETLLWQLNHQNQVAEFQNLAQKSSNLVCLRFRPVPGKTIPVFWLLKTLVQPRDNNIQKADIVFTTQIYSDSQDRLNTIITGLRLPKKLERKKNPDAIAKEIHKKMQQDKKTIVLFFVTNERQQSTEFYELFNLLYQPLLNEFSASKTQQPQKLLMVWIDSSQPAESEAFGEWDGESDRITEMSLCSQFTNDDIMEWTKIATVNQFINRTINNNNLSSSIGNNIGEFIWNQSQKGKPEILLEFVYSLCNLNWEDHQRSWQKI